MEETLDYLQKRVDEQANWYSEKAKFYKKGYYVTELIMLVAGALIPVINVLSIDDLLLRILSASLASLSVISGGVGKLFKFQETWLSYRSLSEALKREKEFYLNKVGDYESDSAEERQKKLTENVEGLLASTTERYISIQRTKKGKEPSPEASNDSDSK